MVTFKSLLKCGYCFVQLPSFGQGDTGLIKSLGFRGMVSRGF
jgi:hypothetical protein